MSHRRSAGFTLIELLVVVAIIGILVAIAAINYRNAIERARQRRAMADMRAVSTALESYSLDFGRYPPSAAFALPPGLSLPTDSLAMARDYIQPTYIRMVPMVDGWNSWFAYGTTVTRTDYALRSNGRLGEPQGSPAYGVTTDFTDDVILVNGQFVQWPEGVQR